MDIGSYAVLVFTILGSVATKIDGGWDTEPNTQYHIQTDEGPERYFKYQTISGQYRKERRLHDGSVVGTYGWVDADGYLRLNDYVADSNGYRVVRNKKLFVGSQSAVGQAVSAAKNVSPVAGTAVTISPYRRSKPVVVTESPRQSSWHGSPFIYPSDTDRSPLQFPSSTTSPFYRQLLTTASPDFFAAVKPVDVNSIAVNGETAAEFQRRSFTPSTTVSPLPVYKQPLRPQTFRPAYRKVVDLSAQGSENEDQYDGVSFVRNGFKYYLPKHYHEEQSNDQEDTRAGSFGYIDPFGIRRVIYYNTAPGTGFVHRKNNRYVGLNAEPFDPRPN
ncbi:uncharacterized protein LOC126904035 isoform X2 [Daktulosphaira vitifoliae]|uniref:uncharacterized protein LOC126904035 isoform X2 n=1 Tax=Daktulosphaira vitifoliae TaxID=58002 RepID=UPI0021AA83D4|nr:uncharacterized protein LOC126904035 isoform X2 [Daktulosphaira vitifoliae]